MANNTEFGLACYSIRVTSAASGAWRRASNTAWSASRRHHLDGGKRPSAASRESGSAARARIHGVEEYLEMK